jgi:hypothetical protein
MKYCIYTILSHFIKYYVYYMHFSHVLTYVYIWYISIWNFKRSSMYFPFTDMLIYTYIHILTKLHIEEVDLLLNIYIHTYTYTYTHNHIHIHILIFTYIFLKIQKRNLPLFWQQLTIFYYVLSFWGLLYTWIIGCASDRIGSVVGNPHISHISSHM